jgi:predicted dehydrogenase
MHNLATGKVEVIKCPIPKLKKGFLLIDTSNSLISSGTERMLINFGNSNLFQKAKNQPERVKEVLNKAKTDGIFSTFEAVKSKLQQPIPLGYCNLGVVSATNVQGFKVGDRVVSNGPHAEVVHVAKNLCARVPDNVSDEEASFSVLASIGLQGIRLSQPTLGEAFIVIGSGLVGLMTIQMLIANGCRVLAIDLDQARLDLAQKFGANIWNPKNGETAESVGHAFSQGLGVDGVIITASSASSDPITQAASMCRKHGRIVLVGVTGLELKRADFYEKEITFQVSCSYGPGRYDVNYEEMGQDYPIGYVRWTEQRNLTAVLEMMSKGTLNVKSLISKRVPFANAIDAYDLLSADKSILGIILSYSDNNKTKHVSSIELNTYQSKCSDEVNIGFIGAGNYASRILMPAFKDAGARLFSIASSGGLNAMINGSKFGFKTVTSDTDGLISNPQINCVAIVTRHNTHAKLAEKSLSMGKHVFLEKPLALSLEELNLVKTAHAKSKQLLMVGFNRRFAPQVQIIKDLLNNISEPKSFLMVMNAGVVPQNHWTKDRLVGGGRIIGEACHYIDLMRYLAGHPIISINAQRMGNHRSFISNEDNAAITLGFEDGSFGTIHYLAHGGKTFPKERIEIFTAGRTLQLDNFRKLYGFNWPGFQKNSLWIQDKGQKACAQAFVNAIINATDAPIPAEELFEVAKVTIEVDDILRQQK